MSGAKAQIEASVKVRCEIDHNGQCRKVQALHGQPLFLTAVLNNAKLWTFEKVKPTSASDKSIDLDYTFIIRKQRKLNDTNFIFEYPNKVTVIGDFDPKAPCGPHLIK
jgi:hypothetical protein